jgi:hypothetical protein
MEPLPAISSERKAGSKRRTNTTLASPLRLSGVTVEAIGIAGYGYTFCNGTEIPADGSEGFAHGCIYVLVSGTGTGDGAYINQGDGNSSLFAPFTIISDTYDLERDIGVVPGSTSAATANRTKLTNALNAMWAGGSFTFANGTVGPVLKPIRAKGGTFYFNGTIETAIRTGGALHGANGLPVEFADDQFGTGGTYGGLNTRFVRLDGQNGGSVFRIRGVGFEVSGIQFFGRRWTLASGSPSGTKTPVAIEVESRTTPPAGRHVIRNCQLFDCDTGIYALDGYYSNGVLVQQEIHADLCTVQNVACEDVDTFFVSNNLQCLGWRFDHITFNGNGVLFDYITGGNPFITDVYINGLQNTLFKVTEVTADNANRFEAYGIHWDHTTANAANYLRLFHYAGANGDATDWRWSVRVTGSINNPNTTYDATQLVKIGAGATSFPKSDLLFDVLNMPTSGFTIVGSGPWYKPS